MKSRRYNLAHFSYGDPRQGYNKYGRRKLSFFQVFVFIAVLIGIITLTVWTLSHQYTESEIKKAFDVGGY